MENNQLELVENSILINAGDFISSITNAILTGEVDPLKGVTVVKKMAKIAEEVLKNEDIKNLALKELDKHLSGKTKSIQLYGATICKAAVHTYYDFSECNDPRLQSLLDIKSQIEHQIALYQEELKLLIPSETKEAQMFGITKDTKDIVVENTFELSLVPSGEVVTVKAPRKIQKMGMKFMKL